MQETDGQGTEKLPPADSCELPRSVQTRNVLIFGINKGMVYFTAPILYIGMNQAALLERLGYDRVICNLPASFYSWMTPLAVLVAWGFPRAKHVRPVLVAGYLCVALAGLLVSTVLLANWTAAVLPVLLLHAGLVGVLLYAIEAFQWEVLFYGVPEKRRGEAFALAFGLGPVLAAAGSLCAQLVLSGQLGSLKMPVLPFPWTFAVLFGATAPLMGLAALMSMWFELPANAPDRQREPFFRGILGGFWEFLCYPPIALSVIAFILINSSLQVMPSITLYTEEATGRSPDSLVNLQQFLRFAGKSVLGLLLAQLLIKTNPKAGMLATGVLCLAGYLWVIFVPGMAFMACFAIIGGGELMGVYYPNYIMSLSRPGYVRRNITYCAMIVMPVGNAPMLFGAISKAISLQASFWTAAAIASGSILICALLLSSRPRPQGEAN